MTAADTALPVVGEWLQVVRSDVEDGGLVVELERETGEVVVVRGVVVEMPR